MKLGVFLLFFSSFAMVTGQSITSINKHVAFSDYLTENITNSASCMRSFHDVLTTYRETNSKVALNYNRVKCISQPKAYDYTEANTTANIGVQDSWKIYSQLYEKNNV